MKKILFLILIFSVSLKNYAQNTFAPVGAEWWYGGKIWDYEYWDYYTQWADHLASIKDTTVDGKACRMLTATRLQKDQVNVSYAVVSRRDTFYVYNNEDTVFCYDKTISAFTPLYIFNVQPGDTLCLRQPNSTLANPEFCIVIDSVVMETFDTAHLLSYYNHNVSGYPLNWGFSVRDDDDFNTYVDRGKYTEKIGGNWQDVGSFFPARLYHNPDYYKDNLLPTGTFRCYNDPVTSIKMFNIPCDSVDKPFVGIKDIDPSKLHISVYPNPSSGKFTVQSVQPFEKDATIIIRDLSGRLIQTIGLPAGKIKIEVTPDKLRSGIYFVIVNTAGGKYYQKIIIQH